MRNISQTARPDETAVNQFILIPWGDMCCLAQPGRRVFYPVLHFLNNWVVAIQYRVPRRMKFFLIACFLFILNGYTRHSVPGQLIVNAKGRGGGAIFGGIRGNVLSESVIDVNASWGKLASKQQCAAILKDLPFFFAQTRISSIVERCSIDRPPSNCTCSRVVCMSLLGVKTGIGISSTQQISPNLFGTLTGSYTPQGGPGLHLATSRNLSASSRAEFGVAAGPPSEVGAHLSLSSRVSSSSSISGKIQVTGDLFAVSECTHEIQCLDMTIHFSAVVTFQSRPNPIRSGP